MSLFVCCTFFKPTITCICSKKAKESKLLLCVALTCPLSYLLLWQKGSRCVVPFTSLVPQPQPLFCSFRFVWVCTKLEIFMRIRKSGVRIQKWRGGKFRVKWQAPILFSVFEVCFLFCCCGFASLANPTLTFILQLNNDHNNNQFLVFSFAFL